MRTPSLEEQRKLVQQWKATGQQLERIRREALRNMPYNWGDVDALLELGAHIQRADSKSSGLVEMQRCFMKAAPRK